MKFVQKLFPLMLVLILLTGMLSACQRVVVQEFSVYETISDDTTVTTTARPTTKKVVTTKPTKRTTKTTTKATTTSTTEFTIAGLPTGLSPLESIEYFNKQYKKLLLGKWSATIDIAPQLIQQEIYVNGAFLVPGTLEFTRSGKLLVEIDKDSFSTAVRPLVTKKLNDILAENEVTTQDFELALGASIHEYINSVIDSLHTYINQTGYYKVDNTTLIIQCGSQDVQYIEYYFQDDGSLQLALHNRKTICTRIKK